MIRTLSRLCVLLACACAGLLAWAAEPAPAPAATPLVQRYTIRTDRSGAQINWLTGQLEAVGLGYTRDDSPLAKRQARTTAMIILQREARKALLTVQIDTNTTLASLAKTKEGLAAVDTALTHLAVIEERWVNRGTLAVVAVLPLYGEQGITYLASKGLATAKALEVKGDDLVLMPAIPRGHTPQRFQAPYTGVIINADRLLLTPCLFPRVLRFDGKELWGPTMPEPMRPVGLINGPVRYAPNLEAAVASGVAGERPLILEAIGVGYGMYPAVNLDDVFLVLNEHKYKGLLHSLPLVITLGCTP